MFVASTPAQAQIQIRPGGKKIVLGKDTLCFRYHFTQGDTLDYTMHSRDSIDIDKRGILAKSRMEKLRIVCDTAMPNRYFLRLLCLAASEYQTTGVDTVFRRDHPWVSRVVTIVIDSLGRRISHSGNSTLAALCPGGAFQPLRLPILDTSCGRQNQSWLSQDTILAVENGLPAPIISQSVLWRVGDKLDTLGRKAQWLMYSLTGFGIVDMTSSEIAMRNTSSIAEAGRIVLDDALKVPLIATIQQENRFTISSASGSKTAGKHLMVVTMELDRIVSSDPARCWERNPQPQRARAKATRRRR